MKKTFYGLWPTMITPFTESDKIDFKAVGKIVDYYVDNGCDGIFAVCQSSEMFFLSPQEKLDLAKCVVEMAGGRIRVIASGHTEDNIDAQIEQLGAMAQTGVEAVVLVSNRLADETQGEDIFISNAQKIFSALPDVTMGIYECPYPYKRLVSNDFLRYCGENGKILFLKDTCCQSNLLRERIEMVKPYDLSILNANTDTILDSLRAGGVGYNGVMANFHPWLYRWLLDNYNCDSETLSLVNNTLVLFSALECRGYPENAKYHMQLSGLPLECYKSRVKRNHPLTESERLAVKSLIALEERLRDKLKRRVK